MTEASAARTCVCLLALAAFACGRVPLEPRPDEDPSPDGGPADVALRDAGAPEDTGAPEDAGAPEARSSAEEAGAPWPVILRIKNVGSRPIPIAPILSPGCGFDLSVGTTDGAPPWPTSATEWDERCPCESCRGFGLRCESVDFLCDLPPRLLAAGDHFDLSWNGLIDVKRALPPELGCGATCDEWQMIAPGRYVFIIGGLAPVSKTEVLLPPPTGIVELPMSAD